MSDNIFKEFCNKVLSFFRQTEAKGDNTKSVACNRLRVVLMQDRTNLTPELLQKMRRELIELLSKYVEMDNDGLELNFDQEDGQMALMLSIPVLRAKDESEIQQEEEKLKSEKQQENDASEKTSDNNDDSELDEIAVDEEKSEADSSVDSDEIEIVEPDDQVSKEEQ